MVEHRRADKGPKISWEATHDCKSELRHVRWLDESAVRLHLTMQALLRSSSCPYSVNGIDEAVRGAARLRLHRLPLHMHNKERSGKRDVAGGEVRGEAGAVREAPWGIASEAKDMKHIPNGVGKAGAEQQKEAWSLS
ncbi:hypothetical protein Q7C36_003408 [Tachysurus vachellii]|uniref:Uncharacterized protein n=1 Tax=Tachysurus vachellii TaxID=175792 RepID=A0AA88T7D6_TACVA|nr:hypothetical protein Q7C36_003408 [Tachysurus vachellii]